jgi:23S rRNA (guanosine2251-2'-O)-methyltransferase
MVKRNEFKDGKRMNTQRRPQDIRDDYRARDIDENVSEDIIIGRNPVIEALKSGKTVEKIYLQKDNIEGTLRVIEAMAKEKGIVTSAVDRRKLDEMSGYDSHQGVVARVTPFVYSTVDEILKVADEKGEDPFIIILDEIEDPHNLGSIIRSANVLGAHGVIIPKRRSALITQVVSKASAGATSYTKVAKVTNINQTIDYLKEKKLWIIGADMDGELCSKCNLKGSVAVVIGNEGSGISRLVKEHCDIIASIPALGDVGSLNASVAAGIIMYEILRQRNL